MKTNPTSRARNSERRPAFGLCSDLHLRRTFLPLLIAACFGSAGANPLGMAVVSGQATLGQNGNLLSITNTPNAIINWQSFSINADEITNFIQQSGSSSVLNRITGQLPSQIFGALQSNGRVFLINPNGIVFGPGAQVDVNGLVASSLAISDANFLSGKYFFTAGITTDSTAGSVAGTVSNQGAITTPGGGQVFLIGPNVDNSDSGIINTANGEVMLAAGHSVQLADSATPGMHVVLSAPADKAINLGQIMARGGKVGIYGALVHQHGTINANSAVMGENGKIVLKASGVVMLEAGSMTTAAEIGTGGETMAAGFGFGGEVSVLGPRVGLIGDARLGGGSVELHADEMMLDGTANAIFGGNVSLAPYSAGTAIELGALDSSGKLGLTESELRTISTPRLAIGGANGGIAITQALNLQMVGSLSLNAADGSSVTQSENAAISGVGAVWAQGDSVNLTAPNGTGVISGAASAGNFQFHSINHIFINNWDQISGGGISAVNGDVTLASPMGIGQAFNAPIAARGLALSSGGPVHLFASNAVGTVAADLSQGTEGGGMFLHNDGDLTVGSVQSLTGINSNGQHIGLSVGQGYGIAIDEALTAGSGSVQLVADAIRLDGKVTASMVDIAPSSPALPITVGAACIDALPCLAVTNLYHVEAQTIGIGAPGQSMGAGTGDITVAAISASGGSLASDRNPLTTRIGLLSGGGVTQTGIIDVQDLGIESFGDADLPLANRVRNLAANVAGRFTFNNAMSLGIAHLTGGAGSGFDPAGFPNDGIPKGTIDGGVYPSTATGTVFEPVTIDPKFTDGAGAGYDLNGVTAGGAMHLASAGAIVQADGALGGAKITGGSLTLASSGGIGTPDTPLLTQVSFLNVENNSATGTQPINIRNNAEQPGELTLQHAAQSGAGNAGAITVHNTGKLIVSGDVVAGAGEIGLVAHSPLVIDGTVLSTSGDILLEAKASDSQQDVLSLGAAASVTSRSGNITLKAGSAISEDPLAAVHSLTGTVTRIPSLGAPEQVTMPVTDLVVPTQDQCALTPSLAICQAFSAPTESDPVKPLNRAMNSAIDLIITGAPAQEPSLLSMLSYKSLDPAEQQGNDGGNGEPAAASSTPGDKDDGDKKDGDKKDGDKKDGDKKDSVDPKDSGVKKDETAKKTYCN